MYISMQKMYIRNSDMYIILIIMISYMPVSSKIKLSGATKPILINLIIVQKLHESSMDG